MARSFIIIFYLDMNFSIERGGRGGGGGGGGKKKNGGGPPSSNIVRLNERITNLLLK